MACNVAASTQRSEQEGPETRCWCIRSNRQRGFCLKGQYAALLDLKVIKSPVCAAPVVLFHLGQRSHDTASLSVDSELFLSFCRSKLGQAHVHVSACETPPPLARQNCCTRTVINTEQATYRNFRKRMQIHAKLRVDANAKAEMIHTLASSPAIFLACSRALTPSHSRPQESPCSGEHAVLASAL